MTSSNRTSASPRAGLRERAPGAPIAPVRVRAVDGRGVGPGDAGFLLPRGGCRPRIPAGGGGAPGQLGVALPVVGQGGSVDGAVVAQVAVGDGGVAGPADVLVAVGLPALVVVPVVGPELVAALLGG